MVRDGLLYLHIDVVFGMGRYGSGRDQFGQKKYSSVIKYSCLSKKIFYKIWVLKPGILYIILLYREFTPLVIL